MEGKRNRNGEEPLPLRAFSRLPVRFPRAVLASTVALLVVAAVYGVPLTGQLKTSISDFENPSSQTARAALLLEKALHVQELNGFAVLLPLPGSPVKSGAARRRISTVAGLIERQRGVRGVVDYLTLPTSELLSKNGRETLVAASFATREESYQAAVKLRPKLRPLGALVSGIDVVFEELTQRARANVEQAELYVLPLLVVLSLLVFRTVVAALLPLVVGGTAILTTFLVLRLIANALALSVFALNLVSALGLGLAIDYALFIVSRFREEVSRQPSTEAAVRATLRSAGRTVLYSALSVASALAALCIFPLRFLYSMGLGGAVVALCCGAAALIVLPALLLLLGPRVDALPLRRPSGRADAFWGRLARAVMARPALYALGSATLLLACGAPVFALGLTPASTGLLPPGTEARVVEERIERKFPDNPATPIEVVIKAPRQRLPTLYEYATYLEGAADLKTATTFHYLGHKLWLFTVQPRGDPFSSANEAAIVRLRAAEGVFPSAAGGITAWFKDEVGTIGEGLPWVLLAVGLTMLVAIFALTGSLVLPLKTLLLNGLTLSVATGALVVCFQDGLLAEPLHFRANGGIEPANLTLLYTVAFALSSDYGVFLLGRVREAHDRGLPNREAVAEGMERTGRLITAAALLFCVAVAALVSSSILSVKELGFGAAFAVAVDASLVRAVLVPSLMALLGSWNWWAPKPLRLLHARLHPVAVAPLAADALAGQGEAEP